MYHFGIKQVKYLFDEEKSLKLKRERGISFEEIVEAIEEKKVVKVFKHHNAEKYPFQQIMLLEIKGYIWQVPLIEDVDTFILKTAYPSRKATIKYLRVHSEENENGKSQKCET